MSIGEQRSMRLSASRFDTIDLASKSAEIISGATGLGEGPRVHRLGTDTRLEPLLTRSTKAPIALSEPAIVTAYASSCAVIDIDDREVETILTAASLGILVWRVPREPVRVVLES